MCPILYSEDDTSGLTSSLKVGTQLFGLYLALQQFHNAGCRILGEGGKGGSGRQKGEEGGRERADVTVFHSWFIGAVAKWLDIALYKAMVRIVRAVRLDSLQPVALTAGHSSSAQDICTVLAQIRTFWGQLSWPDLETGYVFISRIMDDVCKAVIFYAEKMCARAEEGRRERSEQKEKEQELELEQEQELEAPLGCTAEQCLAINNIDYVLSHIQTFVEDLGTQELLRKLEEEAGSLVASACRKTIKTLLKSTLENVENQILTVLEEVGERLAPSVERFLEEAPSLPAEEGRELLRELDKALVFLRARLVAANFRRLLSHLWAVSAGLLSDILQQNIKKKRPPQFFTSLHGTFQVSLPLYRYIHTELGETGYPLQGKLTVIRQHI
jgi:hypothetical protein